MAVEAQFLRDADKHLRVGDVLTAAVESVENAGMEFVRFPLSSGPVGGLMSETRAGLHGWEDHFDAQAFRQREDGLPPGPLDVLAVRVERRDRLRAQLERAPDDLDVRVGLR